MKNNILTQKVVGQEVGSKINVPHDQVVDYYEKHKSEFIRKEQVFLREILIGVESKDPAAIATAEKKAKDVVARARKGERFGDLVRDNSDALTAKQGGDLPGYAKSDLSPELVAAVWDKPKGHITEPIQVPAGFLILRVEEHFKEGQASSGGGGERDQGTALHAAVPAQDPRVSDRVAQDRVPRDPRRLCRHGRRAGQGHALAGPGFVEAGYGFERGGLHAQAAQEAAVGHADPGHGNERSTHTSSSRG